MTRLAVSVIFFFNVTPPAEIYTLSLHDALPISSHRAPEPYWGAGAVKGSSGTKSSAPGNGAAISEPRSEEHTSELQSQFHLVCRLLLEKKNDVPVDNHLEGVILERTFVSPRGLFTLQK